MFLRLKDLLKDVALFGAKVRARRSTFFILLYLSHIHSHALPLMISLSSSKTIAVQGGVFLVSYQPDTSVPGPGRTAIIDLKLSLVHLNIPPAFFFFGFLLHYHERGREHFSFIANLLSLLKSSFRG